MSVANRRVSVVVEGNSASAQEALTKAADAMKALGDMVVRQSKLAIEYDKQVIKSNDAVMASYDRMLSTITRTTTGIDSAVSTQTKAQSKLAESASVTANDITAAAERQAVAMRTSATAFDSAVKTQTDALKRSATQANEAATSISRSAERQATATQAAADRQAAAQRRAAQVSRDSAVKSNEGFNIAGTGLARLGRTTVLTAAGVAAASLYMSAKFEAGTTRLLTQAGATHRQVEIMRASILNMAGSLGQTPEHLDEALYHVVSSMNAVLPPAHRTTEELQIMKIAAEGAAIGHTNLEETSYALASAMNALHLHAGAASQTMGMLNAIVGSGDMNLKDLLDALKSGLIPTARTFGISLSSLGSALAVMGDQGMRGSLAGTRLRMSLALLAAPSKKAAEMLSAVGLSGGEIKARTDAMSEALEAAGLTTTKMAEDLKQPNGLSVAFKDLDEHLRASGLSATQTAALLSRAFGGGRMGSTIMLLAQSTERLDAKYKQIQATTHSFGKDWSATQQTLTFEVHQTEAAVVSLGIRIGEDLTPLARELLGTIKETAEWFEHNEMAARALGIAVGGVLTVAVSAFVAGSLLKMVNTFRQAGSEYTKLQNYFKSGFGSSTTTAAAAGGSTTATAMQQATKVGMIWGVRGAEAPGSIANPIVVVIEGGQYAGLGGRAAAIGMGSVTAGEQAAARAESVTPGGVVLPPGVKNEVAEAEKQALAGASGAEETAIAGSLGSSIKGALGGVMANAMKGGMVAMMGTVAAQLAGTVVGGKTGEKVAHIGTDTALGAAIGTAIEPGIGTAVGAAVGGLGPMLISALKGTTQGEHVADHAAKGMGEAIQKEVSAGIDKANKTAEQSINAIEKRGRDTESEIARAIHNFTGLDFGGEEKIHKTGLQDSEVERARAQKQAELFSVGKTFGSQITTEEMGVTKSFGPIEKLAALIKDVETRLSDKNLPEAARKGAFAAVMAMVKEYQSKGQLPPTAVAEMLRQIESKMPNLKHAFEGAGIESVAELNQALKGQQTLTGVETLVNNWRNILPELPHIVGINMGNAATTFQSVMAKLTQLSRSGPESQRIAASTLYKRMHDEEVKYFGEMRGGIEGEIKHLNSRVGPLTAEGTTAMEKSLSRMKGVIEQEMAAGVRSTASGTQAINKILKGELSAIGLKAPSKLNLSFGPMPGGGGTPLIPTNPGESSGFTGFAGGGLIQFGKPGQKGRDSIHVNMGGTPIKVAPGEQAAIFTHQQQAIANAKMADIGGLPGLFSSHRTPHHMATGGFVPEPGTNFGVGKEPQIAADLRKLAAFKHWTIYGISGYRSPAHSVSVGGFSNDPHTRGEAADIGINSPMLQSASVLTAALLARFGLERPFYPASAHEINHVQLLGSFGGGGGAAGAVGGAGVSAAAQAHAPAIHAPKAGGEGIIHQIAQHVLNRVAAGANQMLGSSESMSFAGVKGQGGAPGQNEKLGRQMMEAAGWSGGEWPSLQALWTQESGWNANSVNSSSGAYGIPQALGHGHPFNLGDARAQIAWGLNYIRGRYGSPSAAEAHEKAFNWYETGGFIPELFATGGKVVKTPKVTPGQKAAAHHYISKPRSTKPSIKHSVATTLARKLGNLNSYAGLEHLDNSMVPFETKLKALGNLDTLVKGMEGDKAGTFILPTDMQYITPTLQPGETIDPMWTTIQAMKSYENAELGLKGEKGEKANELELQSNIIKWAEGQASHRLLTGSQAGILAAPGKAAGVHIEGGKPLMAYQLVVGERELSTLQGQETSAKGLMHTITDAINARHKRGVHMGKLMKHDERRGDKIRQDLQRLNSSSLHERLRAAEDAPATSDRVLEAEEHKRSVQEAIEHEDSLSPRHKNKGLIDQWKAEKDRIDRFIRQEQHNEAHQRQLMARRHRVSSAEVAVIKNNLNNELHPIEEALSQLGGNSHREGTGGMYGKLVSELKTIRADKATVEEDIGTIRDTSIPTVQESLESIRESMTDSEVPKLASSGEESNENTALVELLRQQNQILATNFAVSQAQFAVMSNFKATLPHFDKGGPILDDGPIFAHKDEFVVPKAGALVMSGGGTGSPQLHHTTVVQGDMAALIAVVDSRITHPKNVQAVSRQMSTRTKLFPSRAKTLV